jgi:membrane-associated HD superfamily phosphohydrolase
MPLGKKIWLLSPTIGISLFVLLFYYATLLYPGGSYFNNELTSFSWLQNYWCDLLKDPTLSQKSNPATLIATFAMLVISVSVCSFWIISTHIYPNPKHHRIIQLSGSIGIFSLLLLLVKSYHNIGLLLAGGFSLLAFSLTLINAYQQRFKALFLLACIAIILSLISYSLFFFGYYAIALPIVQKLNLVAIGVWMIATNLVVYQQATGCCTNKKL